MTYKDERSCLGYLGAAYQHNLVKAFIEDKEYFKDLTEIIDQNAFTEPVLKSVVAVMRNHYNKYGAVPSYETIKMYLSDQAHTPHDREQNIATVDAIMNMRCESPDMIKEMGDKFFKQQNIVKTANMILQIAGNGDTARYEECEEMLHKAINAGRHDKKLHRIFDDYEETLSKDYRCPIPTGIGKLDEALEGGIGKGELGVIIGPSGYGKTSITTAMAAFAATYRCEYNNHQGFKVLQIVFEDTVKQIRRKYFSRLTDVEARMLSYDEEIEKVREMTSVDIERNQMLQDNVLIGRFPSGEITADGVKHIIKQCTNEGFKPDLVIIDYFECLKLGGGSGSDKWDEEGKTMRKLEAMVGELNIGCWCAIQGTKDSLSADIVTMDKGGGSFKKMQIAHLIVSITRTLEDIANNIAKISILKNRAGKSGHTFENVYFNNGTCTINTDNSQEFGDIIQYNHAKQENKDQLARNIFKKHKEEIEAQRAASTNLDEEF